MATQISLKEYFQRTKGLGVLSTANEDGTVDAAVYARPHFVDENTIAFVMANKQTLQNLQANEFAHYLFKEEGNEYSGRRLTLRKTGQEADQEKIHNFRRERSDVLYERYKDLEANIVYFHIDDVRPLIGQDEEGDYRRYY